MLYDAEGKDIKKNGGGSIPAFDKWLTDETLKALRAKIVGERQPVFLYGPDGNVIEGSGGYRQGTTVVVKIPLRFLGKTADVV